jgi:hypothetical protein
MNLAEFRQQMETYRQSVDEEARLLKDSYLALDRLHSLYRKFSRTERELADTVLSEWALSGDEKLRFDALALINDFEIVNTTPALRQLENRLVNSSEISAPFELNKVKKILEKLSSS